VVIVFAYHGVWKGARLSATKGMDLLHIWLRPFVAEKEGKMKIWDTDVPNVPYLGFGGDPTDETDNRMKILSTS